MNTVVFGIDFGTTNSVVAKASHDTPPSLIDLAASNTPQTVHPSVLALEAEQAGPAAKIFCQTGKKAIELAAKYPEDVRYVQQFKHYAGSKAFEKARMFGREFTFPDILHLFWTNTTLLNELSSAPGKKRLVIGRPVKFHGRSPDDALAMQRYAEAFGRLGIEDMTFIFEPVGGAYSFLSRLNQSATVLVADLGGGTSDFSIVQYQADRSGSSVQPVAGAGLGVAGSTFDRRIIQNVLLKHFGHGSTYDVWGQELQVPNHFFSSAANWHELAMLRTPQTLKELHSIRRTASRPELIQNLIDTIEKSRGLRYFNAVSEAKAALTASDAVTLSIEMQHDTIHEPITREDFETWISEDLAAIEQTVDKVLSQAALKPRDIDRVFLTGGSSLVPAVRKIFISKFGETRMESGNEFSSVAEGLSLVGLEDDLTLWSA